MTRLQKLNKLQDLVLDMYIEALENKKISPLELGPIVTLLKNNKIIEEKAETPESDLIDSLVEEK